MMHGINSELSQRRFTAAIGSIWHEAELLDRKNYQTWLKLWDPSGFYIVPIAHDATDFAATLNYVYDDNGMREKRVERMTSGYSASAVDAARTVRTVSRFTLTSDVDGIMEVNSAQTLLAYKRGTLTLFGADLTHRIRVGDNESTIIQKVIRLIDSTDALSSIGFLL